MTVTLATFMEVLDTSIANVSLPHIAGSLSVDIDASTWVLTSYLVSNAVVLPVSGWFGTLIGRKRFYMSCVVLFTVSSLLSGLAPNLSTLIVFRILQGAGGGGLQPSEQAILADTFPPEKRGFAFAVYGMAVVLAPAIGPTLGGYITDNFSWRWIFFINVPVGLLSLFLTHRYVEDPPYLARARAALVSIDYIGLGLIVIGLGALQFVLDKGQRDDWFASNLVLGFTVASGAALVLAIVWELYTPHPVVDLRLFKNRSFAISCLMMFMLGFALFGTTVLLPQYLQSVMGYTAELAGMALSPGGVAIILLLPIVGQLVSRVSARWLIAFGFTLLALGLFHMTALNPGISFSNAVWYRIIQSLGLAFLFIPITTNAYVGVPQEQNSEVASMTNLVRNVGGSVGISVVTTMIARRSQFHQARLVAHVSAFDLPYRNQLNQLRSHFFHAGASAADASRLAAGRIHAQLIQQATAIAYVDVIWFVACACAVMVPLSFLLKKTPPGAARVH